jgi:hypothetical protein
LSAATVFAFVARDLRQRFPNLQTPSTADATVNTLG